MYFLRLQRTYKDVRYLAYSEDLEKMYPYTKGIYESNDFNDAIKFEFLHSAYLCKEFYDPCYKISKTSK